MFLGHSSTVPCLGLPPLSRPSLAHQVGTQDRSWGEMIRNSGAGLWGRSRSCRPVPPTAAVTSRNLASDGRAVVGDGLFAPACLVAGHRVQGRPFWGCVPYFEEGIVQFFFRRDSPDPEAPVGSVSRSGARKTKAVAFSPEAWLLTPWDYHSTPAATFLMRRHGVNRTGGGLWAS